MNQLGLFDAPLAPPPPPPPPPVRPAAPIVSVKPKRGGKREPEPVAPPCVIAQPQLSANDERPYWKTRAYQWNGEVLAYEGKHDRAPIEITVRGVRCVVSFGICTCTHAINPPGSAFWSDTGFRSFGGGFGERDERTPEELVAMIEAFVDAPAGGGNGLGGKLVEWWPLSLGPKEPALDLVPAAPEPEPEPEPVAAGRHEWEVIEIDPARLKYGKGDIANSYSAQALAEQGKAKSPFKFRGQDWVSIGSSSQGGKCLRSECYRVVPLAAFVGPSAPYADHDWRGRDDYKTLGTYHGMSAKQGGRDVVLQGPPIVFVEGQSEKTLL